LIIAVLVSALVVPWFIDWNAYRSTFEREAEKILGQPVRVVGSADASLIPMPSLTFTDVRVGGTADDPMMRVARFQMHVELIPLLTGSFKVVDMTIERPQVAVTIDDSGSADWLRRTEASKALDPDAVSLQRVEITDGSISYLDSRSGRVVSLGNINASVDARSLLGPWKVDGSALVEKERTTFRIATGRRAEDGTIRVKVEANPASIPVALSAEGDFSLDASGILWNGGFSLAKVVVNEGGAPPAPGWRSAGQFELRPSLLRLPSFEVAAGPEDRQYSLAGSASVDLGNEMRFDAVVKSRQLDIDRAIGKGPNEPANIDQAASVLVRGLAGLPTPAIPGRIGFDIPGIIVGGAVVQNVRFDVSTSPDGWKIEEFGADMPGRTRLTGDGLVRTEPVPSFAGGVRLASDQPSIFASWWRGKGGANQRPLQPFDMSGQLMLSPMSLDISNMSARLGGSNLRGGVHWQQDRSSGRRDLSLDVKADRFDYDQIGALTHIFAGRSPTEPGGIADAIAVKIAAGTFVADNTSLSNVSADGSYANGILNIRKLSIENLAGARIRAEGRIEGLPAQPSGQALVGIDAEDLAGVTALARRLVPDWTLTQWLQRAGPALSPASLTFNVEAQADQRATNANGKIEGTAGGTSIDARIGFSGTLADWRAGNVKLSARVENANAGVALAQFGYDVGLVPKPGRLFLLAESPNGGGTLATGVPIQATGEVAGLTAGFEGSVGFAESGMPVAHGRLDLSGENANPALDLLLGTLPGSVPPRALALTAALDVEGAAGRITFRDARLGDLHASGNLGLGPAAGGWRLDGAVDVDAADLGYATRLALGLPDEPEDPTAGPWSKTSFSAPIIEGFAADLRVNADRLAIADGLVVANAALSARYSGGTAELSLEKADLAGGSVTGTLSIQNADGDATVSGQFSLKAAELGDLAWQRDSRSIADGRIDLSGTVQGSGRSMAGIVSGLSGSGSLKIGAGTARFVDPGAFAQILRMADQDREIGEDELKKLFAGYLDAGTLAFRGVEGAFSVAAGVIRAQNLEVQTDGATMVGGATIDLNDATLNSQWTLAVEPGDGKVAGVTPQVGLVFRGPVDAPERVVDVTQLSAYLQIRASERRNEEYERLAGEIREKQKLDRMMRFFREDAIRRAEAEKKAAEAAAKAEAERQAAEAAAKAEADRKAAEAAAKADADRKAAEATAKAQAERKAAEAAASRAEAERLAAEAEQRAKAAQAEADRMAAEAKRAAEAARRAAEEPPPFQLEPGLISPPASVPN